MLDYLNIIDASPTFALLQRGGPVVAIIGVMSVIALAVAVMKLVQFLGLNVGGAGTTDAALNDWFRGDANGAIQLLSRRKNPTSRILVHAMKGLSNGVNEGAVREDVERVAQSELAGLRSHLRVLEATSQIAPLLGLFGTVLGMMSAFQALQSAGSEADPAALAGGIWIALITTAVGLAVAIPAGLILYWFEGRIDRETANIEDAVTSLFTARLNSQSGGHAVPVQGLPSQHVEALHPDGARGSSHAAE